MFYIENIYLPLGPPIKSVRFAAPAPAPTSSS